MESNKSTIGKQRLIERIVTGKYKLVQVDWDAFFMCCFLIVGFSSIYFLSWDFKPFKYACISFLGIGLFSRGYEIRKNRLIVRSLLKGDNEQESTLFTYREDLGIDFDRIQKYKKEGLNRKNLEGEALIKKILLDRFLTKFCSISKPYSKLEIGKAMWLVHSLNNDIIYSKELGNFYCIEDFSEEYPEIAEYIEKMTDEYKFGEYKYSKVKTSIKNGKLYVQLQRAF